MKEIILIRHGETDNNVLKKLTGHTDVNLNVQGRSQARSLQYKLRDDKIDKLFSSDLKRCIATATLIGSDKDIEQTAALREMDFGIFESLTHEEIEREYPAEYRAWNSDRLNYVIPGGESYKEMSDRVLTWFSGMLQGPGNKIVLVAHAGCIRIILSYHILGSIEDIWRFAVENATVNRLCIDNDYAYLRSLNDK